MSLPVEDAERQSKEFAYRELLAFIRQDLERFGISFESWFSEASLLSSGAVDQVLAELKTKEPLRSRRRAVVSIFGVWR